MTKYKNKFFSRTAFFRTGIVFGYFILLYGILKFSGMSYFLRPKNLSLYTFMDVIPKKVIKQFELETGIVVNVKYCELDTEFLAQVKLGAVDIDLITPATFVASSLAKDGLLEKIDRTRISCCEDLAKEDFILPFVWTFYAIGYNKQACEKYNFYPSSLKQIFDPIGCGYLNSDFLKNYKVAFYEDNPLESLMVFVRAFFGNAKSFDLQLLDNKMQLQKSIASFKKQWFYGFIYSDIYYYLNSVTNIVVCFASRLQRLVDQHPNKFGMIVPEEGASMITQNFCIPKAGKNHSAAYKFINYCLRPEVLSEIFRETGYLPRKQTALQDLRELENRIDFLSEECMNRVLQEDLQMSIEEAEEFWLTVKNSS